MAAPNRQNKGDLQAEIERYRKSLEENPGSRLFAALADSMRRAGDVSGAIKVAEDGLKRHPRYLGGMVVLGQAYADNQQYDRAKELFLQVVRMNPENIVAQRALADIYEKLGESFNAMRTYAILNILDPSDKKVRARLQELEEARSSSSRPGSTPKPFSTPPPGSMAAAVAAQTAAAAESRAASPAPETANSPFAAPAPGTAPQPAATPESEEKTEPVKAPEPEVSVPETAAAGLTAEAAPAVAPEAGQPVSDTLSPAPAASPEPEAEPTPPPRAPDAVDKRMAGLNQFFAEAGAPEPEPEPKAGVEPSPGPRPVPDDEGSDTAVIAVDPTPPPPPPLPILNLEEKLDLFFGGADLDRVGIAARAQDFVVRAAQEALDEPDAELPPPPLGGGGPEIRLTHSKLGAIFWSQGFQEKALKVMAEEIKARPGDALLRADFGLAARAQGQDPVQVLENLSPGLSTRTAPEPGPEPEETAAETRPEPQPEPAEPAAEPKTDESTTDQRINILRSYLKRIQQTKES